MDRDNIEFLYNISSYVTLNGDILNELSNQDLQQFIQSGEINTIGKTICSTINLLLPYFTKIEDRLTILENVPNANFMIAEPIKRPPRPNFPPPNKIKLSFKRKKRRRHTR